MFANHVVPDRALPSSITTGLVGSEVVGQSIVLSPTQGVSSNEVNQALATSFISGKSSC